MEFSNGQLIYSKTLNEWHTHNGLDILAKLGAPVFAIEDGIVKEISSTPTEGIKITIEHRSGYSSVYSNLSTTQMVNLNDEVKKGQVISGIGKTAAFEYSEPDHLHFEIYKDGLVVNPSGLIFELQKAS
jgi:murein DD-endopeptidase MepM/ murein hydrolase activator NlpD